MAEQTKRVELTADELSALIEACNVANRPSQRPRPPWNTHGRAAWDKLLRAEMENAKNQQGTNDEH